MHVVFTWFLVFYMAKLYNNVFLLFCQPMCIKQVKDIKFNNMVKWNQQPKTSIKIVTKDILRYHWVSHWKLHKCMFMAGLFYYITSYCTCGVVIVSTTCMLQMYRHHLGFPQKEPINYLMQFVSCTECTLWSFLSVNQSANLKKFKNLTNSKTDLLL